MVFEPFNPQKGPLSRNLLVKQSADHFVWIRASYHGISDGVSIHCLAKEVIAAYQSIVTQTPPQFADDTFPTYIEYNHEHFDTPEVLAYWGEKLSSLETLDCAG